MFPSTVSGSTCGTSSALVGLAGSDVLSKMSSIFVNCRRCRHWQPAMRSLWVLCVEDSGPMPRDDRGGDGRSTERGHMSSALIRQEQLTRPASSDGLYR